MTKKAVDGRELNILFLCTGNSCRSQMAEGWARRLLPMNVRPYSAGTQSHGLNQVAVQVMREAGVDISKHRSKRLDQLDVAFDYVITVCDNAYEACPVFPGRAVVLHHNFDDPPRLAAAARTDDDAMDIYRRVRDEIRAFIETLPEVIPDM